MKIIINILTWVIGILVLVSASCIWAYSYSNVHPHKHIHIPQDQPVFVFNPKTHHWYAYDNGKLISSGPASGGRDYCPDSGHYCHTPVGRFHVLSKGPAHCKSTIYPLKTHGGAPMDYCMYFTNYYAIHGSNEVEPGANASHGCIRVYNRAARWLSENFIQIGTLVIIEHY